MKMPKASDQEKTAFRDAVEPIEGAEVKPMFGQLGAFVNGTMFAGLFGSSVGVKLDDAHAESLRGAGGGPFGPEERPMGGYLTVPGGVEADDLPQWLVAAHAYVRGLPPKAKKK